MEFNDLLVKLRKFMYINEINNNEIIQIEDNLYKYNDIYFKYILGNTTYICFNYNQSNIKEYFFYDRIYAEKYINNVHIKFHSKIIRYKTYNYANKKIYFDLFEKSKLTKHYYYDYVKYQLDLITYSARIMFFLTKENNNLIYFKSKFIEPNYIYYEPKLSNNKYINNYKLFN